MGNIGIQFIPVGGEWVGSDFHHLAEAFQSDSLQQEQFNPTLLLNAQERIAVVDDELATSDLALVKVLMAVGVTIFDDVYRAAA